MGCCIAKDLACTGLCEQASEASEQNVTVCRGVVSLGVCIYIYMYMEPVGVCRYSRGIAMIWKFFTLMDHFCKRPERFQCEKA